MKVGEIMKRDVKTLSPDMSVSEALDLILKMQISGLPVIDGENKLVGMFTEKEVLFYILPSYIEKVGGFQYEKNPKSTHKKFSELIKLRVGQLMRKDVLTVREDATLCEVARLMLVQKARRIPIVDEQGRLIGIVSRSDVLMSFIQEAQPGGG